MSINQEVVLDRLRRDKGNFETEMVSFKTMNFSRVEGLPLLELAYRKEHEKTVSHKWPLSPDAYAAVLGIAHRKLSTELLDAMDDDMAAHVVNYFLTGLEGQVQVVLGTGEEGAKNIVSIVPVGQVVVADLDVYDTVIGIAEAHDAELYEFIERADGHIMRFITQREANVRPDAGDIIKAGFEVFTSPKGLATPYVGSWDLRLICTNGMTRMETKNKTVAQAGNPEILLNILREGVLIAVGKFDEDVEHFKELVDRPVEYPHLLIEGIGEEFRLPARDVEQAIEALAAEPDIANSMWGVVNALTRAANNVEIPWESRHRLQRTAFDVVDTHIERCETCGATHRSKEHHSSVAVSEEDEE
jgi:hypothetical protein